MDAAKQAAQIKLAEEQAAIRTALAKAQVDGKQSVVVTLAKNVVFVLLYLVARRLLGTDTLAGGKLISVGDGGAVDMAARLYACKAFRASGGLLKGRTMQLDAPSVALTLLSGSGGGDLQCAGYQSCPAEYHRDAMCSYGRNAEDQLDVADNVQAATVALQAVGLKPVKTTAKE
jgi:hypothetical protein